MKNGKLLILTLVLALGLVLVGCEVAEEPITAPAPDSDEAPVTEEVAYPTVDHMFDFEFPGDWSNVPTTEFTAFYPGQASWQWLNSSDHPGSGSIQAGMGCLTCHTGQEEKLGESLVKGDNKNGLEDNPVEGKVGYKVVTAQAAYDDDKVYFKFEWESERPGISHQYWRYDGEKWVRPGSNRPVKDGVMPSYEDRFAIIIDDQNIPAYDGANIGFEDVGCWQTCHETMREMPGDTLSKEDYQAGIGQDDVRKYLLITRTDHTGADGNWADLKSKEDLAQLQADGKFLDLWMFRAARSGPIGYASDDWSFDYRRGDKGTGSFATPSSPEYMYDESILGFKAIQQDEFERNLLAVANMVKEDVEGRRGVNVVPMDENAEFREGDIVMRRILQNTDGSRADIQVFSKWEDGKWTATFVRDLDTGDALEDKALAEGNVYNIGFGVFDDHVTTRRHFVTLPMTLGLGAAADIEAVKID